jgi:lipopolysaccharide transport system permease protein
MQEPNTSTARPEQNWTEEIKSQDSLFSVNLNEVWQYRDLLFLLIKRDFITFYKQTILGPLWFIVQPLITMVMYVVLFGQIAKLSTDGLPQVAFYLAGITIWGYSIFNIIDGCFCLGIRDDFFGIDHQI